MARQTKHSLQDQTRYTTVSWTQSFMRVNLVQQSPTQFNNTHALLFNFTIWLLLLALL
jgi:hypothetical protein